MFVCLFFCRPPDSKPMRPARKRPAPEDFLGKGPNKKILMGKYVGFFSSCFGVFCSVCFLEGFYGISSVSSYRVCSTNLLSRALV